MHMSSHPQYTGLLVSCGARSYCNGEGPLGPYTGMSEVYSKEYHAGVTNVHLLHGEN